MAGNEGEAENGGEQWAEINKTKRYAELHSHIDARNSDVAHLQLISHNLEHMLAVCLTEVLVKKDTMADGQNTINAVHQEENKPSDITRVHNEAPNAKEHDKTDTNRTHVTSEAFRLTFRAEIKDREYHQCQKDHE